MNIEHVVTPRISISYVNEIIIIPFFTDSSLVIIRSCKQDQVGIIV